MSAILNLPDIRPSFSLDFTSGQIDPRLEIIRAGVGVRWGVNGKFNTLAANTPRIDYNPVTGRCLGLLLEKGQANLLQYSSDISNAYWVKIGISLSSAPVITPAGDTTAHKINEDLSLGQHGIEAAASISGDSDIVFTRFFKPVEKTRVRLSIGRSTTVVDEGVAVFDLANGSIINNPNGLAKISQFPDGWYRCSVVGKVNSTSGNRYGVISLLDSSSATSYQGDGVSGLYVWDGGLYRDKFAYTDIRTNGAAITRHEDSAAITLGDWFNHSEGTLIVDSTVHGASATGFVARLGNDHSAEYLGANYIASGNIALSAYSRNRNSAAASLTVVNGTPQNMPYGSRVRAALSWDSQTFQLTFNGRISPIGEIQTPVLPFTRLSFGQNVNGNSTPMSMHLASVQIYPKKLTASQKQRLTEL